MKTPQEEAEEMARKIAINLFGGQPNSEIGKQIVDRESKEILNVTALPELIAVAWAAEEVNASFGPFIKTPTHLRLSEALQALRATGKVEL